MVLPYFFSIHYQLGFWAYVQIHKTLRDANRQLHSDFYFSFFFGIWGEGGGHAIFDKFPYFTETSEWCPCFSMFTSVCYGSGLFGDEFEFLWF